MQQHEVFGRVAAIARRQHGVASWAQMAATGITRRQVHALVSHGFVERVAAQSYRIAGMPPSWRGDLAAGLCALGPLAAVSHQAAAKLHGFDRFDHEVLEFTVTRSRRTARLPPTTVHTTTVHTTTVLPPWDVTSVDGLATTTPVRTIIDLAALRIRTVRLEAAVDSAIRLRLTTVDEIVDRLTRLRGRGRAGVRRLDRVLITSGGHSLLEREFLKLVHHFGLPSPELQVVHARDGRHVARVDFLFRAQGIVVEVSGGRGHSTAADRAKDARRRNQLQEMGRLVLEFIYEDVMQRRQYVLETLHHAFRTRRPAVTPAVHVTLSSSARNSA